VKADEIRTLVKDIWDIRIAKLRSSIDVFLKSDAAHAKVHNVLPHSQTLSSNVRLRPVGISALSCDSVCLSLHFTGLSVVQSVKRIALTY